MREWAAVWPTLDLLSERGAVARGEELREELEELIAEHAAAERESNEDASGTKPSLCAAPSAAVLRRVSDIAHLSALGQLLGRLLRNKGVADSRALTQLSSVHMPFLQALTRTCEGASLLQQEVMLRLLLEGGVMKGLTTALSRLSSVGPRERRPQQCLCVGLLCQLLHRCCLMCDDRTATLHGDALGATSTGSTSPQVAAAAEEVAAAAADVTVARLPGLCDALTGWLRGMPHWLSLMPSCSSDGAGIGGRWQHTAGGMASVGAASHAAALAWAACEAAADLTCYALEALVGTDRADLQRSLRSADVLEGAAAALAACHHTHRAAQRQRRKQQLLAAGGSSGGGAGGGGAAAPPSSPTNIFDQQRMNTMWAQLCGSVCHLGALIMAEPTDPRRSFSADGGTSRAELWLPPTASHALHSLMLSMVDVLTQPVHATAAAVAEGTVTGCAAAPQAGFGVLLGLLVGCCYFELARDRADAAEEHHDVLRLLHVSPGWARTMLALQQSGCLALLPACDWALRLAMLPDARNRCTAPLWVSHQHRASHQHIPSLQH